MLVEKNEANLFPIPQVKRWAYNNATFGVFFLLLLCYG